MGFENICLSEGRKLLLCFSKSEQFNFVSVHIVLSCLCFYQNYDTAVKEIQDEEERMQKQKEKAEKEAAGTN